MDATAALELIQFRALEALEQTDFHLIDDVLGDKERGFMDCRHALRDILAVIREHERTARAEGVNHAAGN